MLLAMLTMLIDHVGYLFFSNEIIFRIIGRIAFPLYVFMAVLGYHYTKSYKKYLTRLIILAFISQFPYILAFQTLELNVIFLFVVGLLILYSLDHFNKYVAIAILIIMLYVSEVMAIEYGAYGLLLIVIYQYFRGKMIIFAHLMLNLLFLAVYQEYWLIQQFSIVASILIIYREKLDKIPIRVNRTFYRLFYPAHLFVLFLISLFVS